MVRMAGFLFEIVYTGKGRTYGAGARKTHRVPHDYPFSAGADPIFHTFFEYNNCYRQSDRYILTHLF